MARTNSLHFSLGVLSLLLLSGLQSAVAKHEANQTLVNIGLVLDLDSPMGMMAESCIALAKSDFYTMHPTYKTRLVLHTRNSKDVIGAASAVLELLKFEEVQAIIGPQRSTEAEFVVELGGKAHVPIISFSIPTSSRLPSRSPYFIQTTVVDSSQLKAITSLVQGFGWNEVVTISEDTKFGNGFIPYLTDAFQETNIGIPYMSLISPLADDFQIVRELNKLMTLQTTVFLMHMTPFLGSRFFVLARKLGMMREGYVWIITDGLSNYLKSMDATIIESMEGVLGVRPYIPKSKDRENFEKRWKTNLLLMKPNTTTPDLNNFGLWAYDTVWALAMAVERVGPMNSSIIKVKNNENAHNILNLGTSEVGPRLLNEILLTNFKGLSGEFHIVNGQLQSSAFEILNIIGNGERIVGYWSPARGISREFGSIKKPTHVTAMNELKTIIWPGDSTITPKGWAIPQMGKKLRVGVPLKEGFTQFVNVQRIPLTNETNVTGFCIDVFQAVLNRLPFHVVPEFIPFTNESGQSAGTYDDLLSLLSNNTFDAVVGDTTIVADRSLYVDFTLPYTESGVVMVVPVKHDKRKDMWIFIKPLRWDLWLAIVMAWFFIGLVIRILEHRENPQNKFGILFWFPISVLAFPERNMVDSNTSRFVLAIWLFMAFILMQSYTANLSSILTVDQLQPAWDKYSCVGYQDGSFVRDLLVERLKIDPSKLKTYSTIDAYHTALSKGCRQGGVDAIFDELPYVKLFLHKYGSKYMTVGQTQKTDGFGFAFPVGSPLVRYISREILNVTEDTIMQTIEDNNFGHGYSSQDYDLQDSPHSPSLGAYSFAGLFLVMGFLTLLALVFSEISLFGPRIGIMAGHYIQKCVSCSPSNGIEHQENPLGIANQSDHNASKANEGIEENMDNDEDVDDNDDHGDDENDDHGNDEIAADDNEDHDYDRDDENNDHGGVGDHSDDENDDHGNDEIAADHDYDKDDENNDHGGDGDHSHEFHSS